SARASAAAGALSANARHRGDGSERRYLARPAAIVPGIGTECEHRGAAAISRRVGGAGAAWRRGLRAAFHGPRPKAHRARVRGRAADPNWYHARRTSGRSAARWSAARSVRLRPSSKTMNLPDTTLVFDLIQAF